MTIHWAPPKPSQTMPSSWSTVLCVNKMEADLTGFNIDAPRWDQRTFLGRVKHFLNITDPRTVFVSEQELDWAKVMVEKSRMGVVPPGTQVEQLLYAKKLYDSAFHPDTGEKMNVIGRMSFQLPGGMIITGFMLQFYRTMPAVIFWQWVNQSFNALVNYTNRNAASTISVRQMTLSYFTATTTAVATAVGMNMLTKKAPPLVGRWVPFAAVAAANCVNIPMMRQQELIQGICVKDRNENEIGHSRRAAAIGITQVVISRITMSAPGMILLPVVMERLEKLHFMQKVKVLHAPLQVMLCGYFLIFMVPVACGLFPQKCELPVSYLEPELQDTIKAKGAWLPFRNNLFSNTVKNHYTSFSFFFLLWKTGKLALPPHSRWLHQ
ncbi:PREDICTED: sideroflexin-2 isoform X3 [Rhinopithecus bieti]|uniref:sideroflexin-2 isoform X3 n=1 Tax=Rhinopithecus bieti TaxID=61621 RepID=UPI00083BF5E9|nr:PREDICTED: sideroflexin-2 isoform X3 [Rhinopithecus bieti]